MKTHAWDSQKNHWLKIHRGITFDEVIVLIEGGCLVDILSHPNKERYPNQNIYVVNVKGYAYLVPYIETDKEIFLKTIIPSRKATKQYMKRGH